jgi:hypothetical protein
LNFHLSSQPIKASATADGGGTHSELASACAARRVVYQIALRRLAGRSAASALLQLCSPTRLSVEFVPVHLPQCAHLRACACTACATKRGRRHRSMLLHALFWATGGRLHLHPSCITLEQSTIDTYICWMLELERVMHHTSTSCVYATRVECFCVWIHIHRINSSELLIA